MAGTDLPVGAPAVLALRPEKVLIGPAAAGENRFDAMIEELVYYGDHTRLRLSLGGSDSFTARLTFRDGLPALQRGERIPVGWAAANCLVLGPEET